LVLYNSEQPSTPWPGYMAQRQLSSLVPLAAWWQGETALASSLQTLQNQTIIAAAGVAQPTRFFNMLRDIGLNIIELPLPDHYNFTNLPWEPNAQAVIVTEKDAVKLHPDQAGTHHVWVATLEFSFCAEFCVALHSALVRCGAVEHAPTLTS
jgi:tetraacyldisaccharide 4'-kinase